MDWPASQKESQKWFNGLAAVKQKPQASNQGWVVTGGVIEFLCKFWF
jgi:hypothetical protein